MSSTNQSSHRSHKLAIFLTVFSILAAVLLLLNRQYVVDQISVWQYQPSSQIQALSERAGLSQQGKFYFYASRPQLEGTQVFNQKCDRKEESTAILGCYTGQYIYIYDVTDTQLDGIREVTAAHEMLHAAYDRLSEGERDRVGALLDNEYKNLKDDEKFSERMAFYARTEPGERENELHSIIGTEITSIGSELESYYKQYFVDRTKIVSLHHKYEKVFTDLRAHAESLAARLTQLGDAIEADSAGYNADVERLNQDIKLFNQQAQNGGFSSQTEFEKARGVLLAHVAQLENLRVSVNDKVTRYEALREELQTIASQSEALNHSIDSSLAPAPSL